MSKKKILTGELIPKSEQLGYDGEAPSKKNGWGNLKPRIKGDPNSGGRKPGSLNKMTREVKDVIDRCFYAIGGEEAFAKWARRNPDEYYKIYAKLLPIRLQADVSKEINVYITRDDANL